MRYRDLETGTFLTRDPTGFSDGPNLYCYVHCNPITSFDKLGLAAADTHYFGMFLTLAATGMDIGRAQNIALYSDYPDLDKRYDAIACAFDLSPEAVDRAAQLHMLTGSSMTEILKTRERLLSLIPNATSDAEAGIMMHAFVDSFFHLEMEFDSKRIRSRRPGSKGSRSRRVRVPNGGSKDKTYQFSTRADGEFGLGHLGDLKMPDMIRLRPEFAKECFRAIFKLFGGTDMSKLQPLIDAVDKIRDDQMSTKAATELLMNLSIKEGMDPGRLNFKQYYEDKVEGTLDAINPTEMDNLIRQWNNQWKTYGGGKGRMPGSTK